MVREPIFVTKFFHFPLFKRLVVFTVREAVIIELVLV